jgi:Leucine-rich repeat (LRR) protein
VKSLGLVNVFPMNKALALAAQLPTVTELEVVALPHNDLDDAGLGHIARMAPLEKLQVVGPRITDRGAAELAKLVSLQELSLDGPITDEAVSTFAALTELRLLDLYGTRVTGEGLAALAPLAQLEFLCLDRTRVGDAGLESIAQLAALRTLLLRGAPVSDAGMANLTFLPNLERLDLDGAAVTDEGVAALAGTIDPQLMTFTGPTQLRRLSLRGAPNLRGDNIGAIANLYGLPFLTRLDVVGTPLAADKAKLDQLQRAEATVEHWRRLPRRRSEGPIARFDENGELYGLYFIDPAFPISSEGLSELFNYPPATLQELSLPESTLRRGTEETPGDLHQLSKLTNLRKLNLYKTDVADADLLQLAPLTNLRELYLAESDTQVTPEGEQSLIDAISGLQIMRLP